MTCTTAEGGAPKAILGSARAIVGAKTQAGYAHVGRKGQKKIDRSF